jgi:membrane protease YdiL (CAAX protease family)
VADYSKRGAERGLFHPAAALPLLLILGPYYVNKFIYVAYPGDYTVFMAADYANRVVTLGVLWLVVRGRSAGFAMPWRFSLAARKDWLFALAGTAILIAADALGSPVKQWLNDQTGRFTRYPSEAGHPLLSLFDNSAGCLFVGFSEEAIFRFYLINVLLKRGLSMPAAIVVSTALFAAIHWSYGGGNVAYSAVAGLVLALIYVATRNLFAPVLIHAAVDTYYFTDADQVVRNLIW